MAEAKIQFERLNNFNWTSWKFRMELLLVQNDLLEMVTEQKPTVVPVGWLAKDGKAVARFGVGQRPVVPCHGRNHGVRNVECIEELPRAGLFD